MSKARDLQGKGAPKEGLLIQHVYTLVGPHQWIRWNVIQISTLSMFKCVDMLLF